ncbi:MAG: hypothetical protein ACI4QH_03600, partial [Candidatus Fimimonas sp.]
IMVFHAVFRISFSLTLYFSFITKKACLLIILQTFAVVNSNAAFESALASKEGAASNAKSVLHTIQLRTDTVSELKIIFQMPKVFCLQEF